MTSRDFCYWLQGYLEIENAGGGRPVFGASQVECIQKHLALVFKHEIDPSAGPPEHQAELDAIHEGDKKPTAASTKPARPNFGGGHGPGGTVYRC